LHLRDVNDKKTAEKVRAKLQNLPDAYKKLFRIVERDELYQIGADPNAALAITPVPGVAMSASLDGDVLKPRRGGTHGYYPDFQQIQTGFVAWGSGIAKAKNLEIMGLEDIAPLISKLLALDFKTKDGVLYPGILAAGE
jgi:hypothetical protein